jgi:hypothetical protein
LEIVICRASGYEKVARRETSGVSQVGFRALKERQKILSASLTREMSAHNVPDVSRLATFSLRLRR